MGQPQRVSWLSPMSDPTHLARSKQSKRPNGTRLGLAGPPDFVRGSNLPKAAKKVKLGQGGMLLVLLTSSKEAISPTAANKAASKVIVAKCICVPLRAGHSYLSERFFCWAVLLQLG